MKKATAIFFILCANLILIAHMLVPHHHHEGFACFSPPFHESHHDCQGHHHTDVPDQNSGSEENKCSLSELLAIIPDAYRQESILFEKILMDGATKYLAISDFHITELLRYKVLLRFINTKPISYGTLCHFKGAHALRAPPYC